MTLTYSVDDREELVTITGEYSGADEWKPLLERIVHDNRIREGFAFLRDLRGATSPTDAATVVAVMEMVQRLWPRLKPSRGAIVTSRLIDPPALVAHAIADAQRLPIEMFTSYDAAIEWLRHGRGAPGGASSTGAT